MTLKAENKKQNSDIAMENGKRYRLGVGMMILNDQNQVFVAQRIDNSAPAWQMPQGGIDENEDPRSAALRELKEEIGSDNVDFIHETNHWLKYEFPGGLAEKLWDGRFAGQKQKWYLMRFKGEDAEINLETPEPEFSSWQWVDAQKLPNLAVAFKKYIYEKVLEEFQEYFR